MIENPMMHPHSANFITEWSKEHERVLRDRPPRFFVTRIGDAREIDRLKASGYGLLGSRIDLVLFERGYKPEQLNTTEIDRLLSERYVEGLLYGSLPFTAVFRRDHRVDLYTKDLRQIGRWNLSSSGLLCTRWRYQPYSYNVCYHLYRNPDGLYSAFEPSGREVAEGMRAVTRTRSDLIAHGGYAFSDATTAKSPVK